MKGSIKENQEDQKPLSGWYLLSSKAALKTKKTQKRSTYPRPTPSLRRAHRGGEAHHVGLQADRLRGSSVFPRR